MSKIVKRYSPEHFGKAEVEFRREFDLQLDDARRYFENVIRPRLDRAYKLYIAYAGDRQKEIKKWQSNIHVPYIQAVIETLVPRIVDSRPEFTVLGREQEDTLKAGKQQQLLYYQWENAGMDKVTEDFIRSILIYGTGFLQVFWKKDVRKLKFLRSDDLNKAKLVWKEEVRTFFEGPVCEWVDPYDLWYDWHNTAHNTKQYWFRRRILTEEAIRRRYPGADKKRLEMALASEGGDMSDYASVRNLVKSTHDSITKGSSAPYTISGSLGEEKYQYIQNSQMKMYEVFEWWRPFNDSYAVIIGSDKVPIFKNGFMPNPFDFKEDPFVSAQYLKVPGEFEGYGIPLILESPQIMLNLIKNQRLDAATLNIHKMWIVNPLANINKEELVTRPFGIIYSTDPNGAREVQFSDVKMSAYKEEELLKGDMQYASGVDDFSMGVGGSAGSATEVRHLRESTLERVRMFVNHLGDAYSDVLRYFIDMTRQLMSEELTIRVLGESGAEQFPLISKDDLYGKYDYKARVLPSIAGQNEIEKKQSMDLFQLLVNLPFVDPKKLTTKAISPWGWTLDNIVQEGAPEGAMPPDGGNPQEALAAMMAGGPPPQQPPQPGMNPAMTNGMPPLPPFPDGQGGPGKRIKSRTLNSAMRYLRTGKERYADVNAFSELSSPVDLLQSKGVPPTPRGVDPNVSGMIPNSAGFNRKIGSRVDTNVPSNKPHDPSSEILSKATRLQKRDK